MEVVFPITLDSARNVIGRDPLAAWIGFRLEELSRERVIGSMLVEQKLIAPNGFLHAAVVTALADITCGLGTSIYLPDAAHGFATLEIKTNLMGTARKGELYCEAVPKHVGAATQVWDGEVRSRETGKTTVLFRCTQMILELR